MADPIPIQNLLQRRSPVWMYYNEELVTNEDGLVELFAKCKQCGKKLLVKKNAGTGHLIVGNMP